jgi:hypothetical protein
VTSRLRIVRIDWPFPALELVRPDDTGWLLLRLPAARWRLVRRTWPRRGLYLADTPRPTCPDCQGEGGWQRDYGHPETGEYDGTEDVLCACWDAELAVRLVPLPARPLWLRRRQWSGYSDWPPF